MKRFLCISIVTLSLALLFSDTAEARGRHRLRGRFRRHLACAQQVQVVSCQAPSAPVAAPAPVIRPKPPKPGR